MSEADKAKKLVEDKKRLEEVENNQWTPVPSYRIDREQIKKPKVNEDIEEDAFKVSVWCDEEIVQANLVFFFCMKLTSEDEFEHTFRNISTTAQEMKFTIKKKVAIKMVGKTDMEVVIS